MNKFKKFLAIIPARGNSKRIQNKNILPFNSKPMIFYAISAALNSKYISKVYVNSDSETINKISSQYGALIYKRSDKLADDKTYKLDVIKDFIKKKKTKEEYIVILQANSPQILTKHIDKCIKHFIKFKRDEVISVDINNNQDAAIRVIKKNKLFENNFGTHIGFVKTNLIDVNTREDYINLKKKYEKKK